MKENIIQDKSFLFAVRIINLYKCNIEKLTSIILKNLEVTTGTVTDVRYISRGAYALHYKYVVNNNTYKNNIGIEKFIGNNKKLGCLGCSFKVYYSSENPEKSRIFLAEFEKYKTTVEFVNFPDQ